MSAVTCPKCGATGSENCTTARGNDHQARIRAEIATLRQGATGLGNLSPEMHAATEAELERRGAVKAIHAQIDAAGALSPERHAHDSEPMMGEALTMAEYLGDDLPKPEPIKGLSIASDVSPGNMASPEQIARVVTDALAAEGMLPLGQEDLYDVLRRAAQAGVVSGLEQAHQLYHDGDLNRYHSRLAARSADALYALSRPIGED